MIRDLLQDEIDRCRLLVDKLSISYQTKTWSKTVGAHIERDIKQAEKAIKDKDDTAMFRTLQALRQTN